jgi:thiosulfate dehydrogenase [quinone] large subunit
LNIWGQIFIGIGLIAGLFSTTASLFGAFLMLSYYIAIPPFLKTYTFVDKNLFEFFGFLIIALFPTSKILGLDFLLEKYRGIGNE